MRDNDLVEVLIDGHKRTVPRVLAKELQLPIVAEDEKLNREYSRMMAVGVASVAVAFLIVFWLWIIGSL